MEPTQTAGPSVVSTQGSQQHYVDWAAVLGGAVVATAVAGLFAAFGAGLGLSAISAEPGEGSFNLSVILTAVWMAVTLVASYAVGGYIAGRMRRRVDQASPEEVTVRDGINGLIVWGVAMIVGAMLVANVVSSSVSAVGQVAVTATEAAGSALGGAAQGALGAAAAALPRQAMDDPATYFSDSLLRPAAANATNSTPEDIALQSASILSNVAMTGEISDPDRAYLVSAAAARTGLTPPEVDARVNAAVEAAQSARTEALRMMEDAQQKAIDAAEAARVGAVLTGFLIAAASLVAAVASYVGAVRGGRHRDEGRVFGGLAYRR